MMHPFEMQAQALAAQFLAICRRGFVNEHAWLAWRKKHAKEIEALPLDLRNEVCMAWHNATAKDFSK